MLRPQPRGMCGSTGPMDGLTLHDYARDVAVVIRRLADGAAFVLGHAFGQWIGRCAGGRSSASVRGVILAAAAAKSANPALRDELAKCIDTNLPDPVRLAALQVAFFAPGHDPSSWLDNWHPMASKSAACRECGDTAGRLVGCRVCAGAGSAGRVRPVAAG